MNSAVAASTPRSALENDLSGIMPVNAAFLAKPRKLLIDRAWVTAASGKIFEVRDPSSDRVIARCALGDSVDVELAVAAARRAFEAGDWAQMKPVDRERVLHRLADLIEQHADELAELEAIDNGKSVLMARHVDIKHALEVWRYMAGWPIKLEGKTLPLSGTLVPGQQYAAFSTREPVGVVGAIIAWNFHFLLATWKCAPALAAGCTVVLKPAEETPLTALRLGELALEAGLPKGVLHVVTGMGPTAGAALTAHAGVDKVTLQAALIPERVAVRFAFTYTRVDGFIQNALPGHPDLEGVDQYGVRLSLLYKASDDLEFMLRFSKRMQVPQNYAIIDGRIPAPSANSPGGVGISGYFRTQDGSYTGAPLSNHQIAQEYTPRRRQDNEAVSLTAEWTAFPHNKLTSITSWDEGALFNPEGTDGAPYGIWSIPYTGKTRQVTQDLRLTSIGNAPLRYIVGAYYQHEIIFNSTEDQIFTDPTFNTNHDYRDCAASSFTPGGGYSIGSNINLGCEYYNSFDQIRKTWAAYTDDSYKLADWVTLRAGLRYNHDNGSQKNALDQLRGSDQVPIANLGFFSMAPNGIMEPTLVLPGSPNYDALTNQTRSQTLHNTALTGRAGADFTLTSDVLLYVNYSRGYRSAAFNAQFLFTPSDLTTVKPETLDSFEAGFKTSWFEHRLQVDGAVFHYQYKDQQIINVYPTGQQPLINLGKSKIDGGEIEIVTRPVRSLILCASAGFLHSDVQDGMLATGSIDGQQLPYAPHVSGTVGVDWGAWQIDAVKFDVHVDTNCNSKQYLALPNEDAISQGGYSLLNGRLSLQSGDDRWDIGVWGRNVANKFYLTNAVDVQGFGFDYRHVGTPRMFGVDAHYHF